MPLEPVFARLSRGLPHFIDEPINGLDPEGIVEFRRMLQKLNKEKNTTILISSHILSEAEELATRFAFIHHGEVLQELTKEQLQAESRKYLEVTVDMPERAIVALERECTDAVYKVLPDRKIQIHGYLDRGDLITSVLMKHDVKVFSLQVQGGNLEDYFMTVIGR